VKHPHSDSMYCPKCGQGLATTVPEGDLHERLVCLDCQFVHYLNPSPVAGVVPVRDDGKVLLIRRDIEPQRGLWQVPSGFVEMDESTEETAARELMEEAGLGLSGELQLLNVYTARWGLVVINYEGVAQGEASVEHEVSEVRWFAPAELPWTELAFQSTESALREWMRRRGLGTPEPWATAFEG
jgi:ADP-ribose pyrophosphatase YjhB (NUDIX family)